MVDHRQEIAEQTIEHIGLTFVALSIAILAGVPFGLLLTRWKRVATPALGLVGVIQTIPSVALLGFLLPWLGIGVVPAIVALFLYALLPIVRNTYIGIEEVDPAVKDAARGMGMSDFQMLTRVELPLAISVIFAGVRTATIINIGVATLCALIGSGGLGEFIFRGIALNNVYMILAGAVPAALLALTFDLILGWLQRRIHKMLKPLAWIAAFTLIVSFPAALVSGLFQSEFMAGFPTEFMERADGYRGLSQTYELDLNTMELDPGLMYQALKEKEVDVISGFSTDGRIKAFDLRVLDDDKHYFPPYFAAPLVHGETLRRHPELRDALSRIAGKISNQTMAEMNYRVDELHEPTRKVAGDFLLSLGLKTGMDREAEPGIVIGSKNFTEQFILAEILGLLIENYTDLSIELKSGLAGTKICYDALVAGEIDLYPEYTGTGLLVLLEADAAVRDPIIRDPEKVYDYVRRELADRDDLHWLEPFGFNNTYALMMRARAAERLKIQSISDLSARLKMERNP